MDNANDILVLYVRPYSFPDQKSGEVIEGATVYYLNQQTFQSERDGFGHPPVKANIKDVSALTQVPGVYAANMVPYFAKGNMSYRLDSVTFKEGCDLWKK